MILTEISQSALEDLRNVASLSQDPSTKCGAVIYDGNRFVGRGCNNPRPEVSQFFSKHWMAKDESLCCLLNNRNFKLNITEHAECAAIRNSKENGKHIYTSATIFVTSTPCLNCATEIVEAGLKHVAIVEHMPLFTNPSWGELWRLSLLYLSANDVEIGFYDKFGKLMARVEAGAIVPCEGN